MSMYKSNDSSYVYICCVQAERVLLEGELKRLSETEVILYYTLYCIILHYKTLYSMHSFHASH
jgi:hypothetical protein